MKKLLSFFVFLFLVTLQINAQPPKGMGQSDPQAKKILDAVSTKFRSYKSVKAAFSLKIENASGKNIGTKTGTVYMKGTRYRVSITGEEIYSDGSNTYTYDKSAKEITINKIDPTVNSITPQKLFTNFYDQDFLYKLNGKVTLNGKKVQEIELTPVDKSKPFHKVLLYIDNNTIINTKIFEKTGNRYTYSVSNMNTTTNIPDSTFVFDAKSYPGVEIVDLR